MPRPRISSNPTTNKAQLEKKKYVPIFIRLIPAPNPTHRAAMTTQRTDPVPNLDRVKYNLLVEFACRHTGFHWPELESVLGIAGIKIGVDVHIVPLPSNPGHQRPLPVTAGNETDVTCGSSETVSAKKRPRDASGLNAVADSQARSFLVLSFPHEAVGSLFRHDVIGAGGKEGDLPDIKSLLSRCVLIRSVVELWGGGVDLAACADSVRGFAQADAAGRRAGGAQSVLAPHIADDRSWKITVHTLGSKYTREEQNDMRSAFSFLNLGGRVQMEDPDDEFILIQEVALDPKGSPLYPRHSHKQTVIEENDSLPPLAVYFGRILGGERNWRSDLERFSLKKRAYLGPTSMDAELSLVMTNLAQVREGGIAFDPFVGTGSILLSCGLRGAQCFGTDIDIRVLRGKGDGESVFSNFRQYGLPRPDLVRSDNALYHRHYRCGGAAGVRYASIVTDPPYGIRAGARKSGSSRAEVRPVADEHRHDHIAQTQPYCVSDVMADLMDVAARTLEVGGRLVYIIPSMRDFDEATDLPRHACLRLVYTCFQTLSMEYGRRVVTMEKVAEYDPARRRDYLAATWANGPESAEKCANIRARILEAAKKKPKNEEKLAFRKQKRREHRQAKKREKRAQQAADHC